MGDDGKAVCKGSGPLSDASWILEGSTYDAAFYRIGCVDISLNSRKRYVIRVNIRDVDPKSPDIVVAPVISGGGNELP